MSPPEQDRPDELDRLVADPNAAGLLGQVLAAAAAPAEAGPQVGEDAARSAFRTAFPVTREQQSRSLSRTSGRVVVAVLAGGLVLSGAVGAAAAGALPTTAQQTAKDILGAVGVRVPGPDEPAAVQPNQPGTSTRRPLTRPEPNSASRDDGQSRTGGVVSDLARSSASTGVGKGAAVSGEASSGKSHASERGHHGKPAGSPPGQSKKQTHKPHPSKHPKPNTHKRGQQPSTHKAKPPTAHSPSPKASPGPDSRSERR